VCMATTSKIIVGIDDLVIELTGADKEAFLDQRAKDKLESERLQKLAQTNNELKVSAYTKLGLTTEEINAII